MAVVAEDKPQAKVLFVNEQAYHLGILPGLRYAAALSLSGCLRAGVVSAERLEAGMESMLSVLRRSTPVVEPSSSFPGVFWLGAGGLGRLFENPKVWGEALRAHVVEAGYRAGVVVGWTRFGTYAIARGGTTRQTSVVLSSPETEREAARRVALDRLGLNPDLREGLKKLGITTVGAFMDLPSAGLRTRFGEEAWELHALARGEMWNPLRGVTEKLPLVTFMDLESPQGDLYALLDLVRTLLGPFLKELQNRDELLQRLRLDLLFDAGEKRSLAVAPAAPTLNEDRLLELVRLRLEGANWSSGVAGMGLEVEGSRTRSTQLDLFVEKPRRDLAALSRALARVRARYGESSVVRAILREAHLPEASFAWEPSVICVPPRPEDPPLQVLVRKIYAQPLRLAPRPHHTHDDGWLIRGLGFGAVTRMRGPFILSGGWWRRTIHREYHWAETRSGHALWVFYDRRRRTWFLQGEIK